MDDIEKQAYERSRAQRQEDSDDLNREAAGVQGNRIARFKGDDADSRLGTTNKKDNDADELADFMLAEILTATQDMLLRRIDLLDRASLEALREAEKSLEATRHAANRAKDGRRVYGTQDGRHVFDEQGKEVIRDEIEPTKWKSGAPTWERYQQSVTEVDKTKEFRAEVQKQESRLEGDNLSADELNDIEAELNELERDMPGNVRPHHDRLSTSDPNLKTEPSRTTSAAAAQDGAPVFETAPKVADSFAVAASGASEASPAAPGVPMARPGEDFTV